VRTVLSVALGQVLFNDRSETRGIEGLDGEVFWKGECVEDEFARGRFESFGKQFGRRPLA